MTMFPPPNPCPTCGSDLFLPAQSVAPEWQPIETAPKDGTPVLIWDPNTYQGKGGVFIGVYMNTRDYGMQWFCHPSSIRADPTHWQPYPVGPTAPIVASPQPETES